MIDFTSHPSLLSFPWEETVRAMALSEKTIGTFNVGALQGYGLQNVQYPDMRPTDKRWYLGLKHGFPLDGFNINVTEAKKLPVPWFKTSISSEWHPSKNYPLFSTMLAWLKQSGIFKSTGRILFFVTLPGQYSPAHVDFTHNSTPLPDGFKAPEFLWITPPDNPKILLSNGVTAPWACCFNPMLEHKTMPSDKTQWSLRIDGEFA